MQTHAWFPRSLRNRMALFVSVCSLICFIAWNLMRFDNQLIIYPDKPTARGLHQVWPLMFDIMMEAERFFLSLGPLAGLIYAECFLIVLTGLLSIATPFLGPIFQKSKLLRFIPAAILITGACVFGYWNFFQEYGKVDLFSWIIANQFLAALGLCLFCLESDEVEQPY
jgi:hypothetical protein